MVDYESLEPKFSERRSTAFKWKTTWNFQRKQILQFLRQTEWEASWNTLLAAVVYTFGRNFTWPTSDHKLNSQFPLDTLTKQLAKIFSIWNSSRGDLIQKFKFVNQTIKICPQIELPAKGIHYQTRLLTISKITLMFILNLVYHQIYQKCNYYIYI